MSDHAEERRCRIGLDRTALEETEDRAQRATTCPAPLTAPSTRRASITAPQAVFRHDLHGLDDGDVVELVHVVLVEEQPVQPRERRGDAIGRRRILQPQPGREADAEQRDQRSRRPSASARAAPSRARRRRLRPVRAAAASAAGCAEAGRRPAAGRPLQAPMRRSAPRGSAATFAAAAASAGVASHGAIAIPASAPPAVFVSGDPGSHGAAWSARRVRRAAGAPCPMRVHVRRVRRCDEHAPATSVRARALRTPARARRPAGCGRRAHAGCRCSRRAPTRSPARPARSPSPAAHRAGARATVRHDRRAPERAWPSATVAVDACRAPGVMAMPGMRERGKRDSPKNVR